MALGTRKEFERKRLRGVAMIEQGWSPTEIARSLGVHRSTVYNWIKRGTGEEAKTQKPGPQPQLDATAQRRLLGMLEKGATAHGFANDLWTGRRVADLIRRELGVSYHYKYIPVLLRRLGWSWQKPQGRAIERDEAAVRRWVERDWPRIKKKPGARGQR